jgi:hypothetical protein
VSRSDTSAEPSGRNANPHGVRKPLATVATTCGCTGPVGDGSGTGGEVGVGFAGADAAGLADPAAGEDVAGVLDAEAAGELALGFAGSDLEVQPAVSKVAAATTATAARSLARPQRPITSCWQNRRFPAAVGFWRPAGARHISGPPGRR